MIYWLSRLHCSVISWIISIRRLTLKQKCPISTVACCFLPLIRGKIWVNIDRLQKKNGNWWIDDSYGVNLMSTKGTCNKSIEFHLRAFQKSTLREQIFWCNLIHIVYWLYLRYKRNSVFLFYCSSKTRGASRVVRVAIVGHVHKVSSLWFWGSSEHLTESTKTAFSVVIFLFQSLFAIIIF